MSEKYFYNWHHFENDTEIIAKAIEASGKKFERVYGVPRGGLPLAVCLSHRLGIELVTESPLALPSKYNNGESFWPPEYYAAWQQEINDLIRKRVKGLLVVDDIADTGKTLKDFADAGFFIATLFKHPQSAVEPKISVNTKDNRWIVFPWETEASSKYDKTPS